MTYKSYAQLITEQYNKFAKMYRESVDLPLMVERSFAAFMCNQIALGVTKSTSRELKKYFEKHANE